MKIPPDVLAVLSRAETDGARLHLPGPQLNPRLYQQVNDVIEAVGGRWDKNVGDHLFPSDAAAALAPVLASGYVTTLRETRTATQYFPTPTPVVSRLMDLAALKPGMEVLEPSAGRGAIAAAAVKHGAVVDCIEQDAEHATALQDSIAVRSVKVADFLAVPPAPRYDRVVMNPPFTKQADVAHVTHALRFLKPDGLLVAVMSWGVTFQIGEAAKFRNVVEQRGGTVEALAEGAFTESGTGVDTLVVTIPAARPADAQPVVWPRREVQKESEAEFGDPAEIAAEIAADLRKAFDIFDQLARDLAKPAAAPAPTKPVVTVIPRQSKPSGQLAFDMDDSVREAS